MKEEIYKGYKIRVSNRLKDGGWKPQAQVWSATGPTVTSKPLTWYPDKPFLTSEEAENVAIQKAKAWIDAKS